MNEMRKRRAALGAVLVVAGVILVLSTLGATAFGGRCTTEICSVPGTERLLVTGLVLAVVGAIVISVAIRGMRRNGAEGK